MLAAAILFCVIAIEPAPRASPDLRPQDLRRVEQTEADVGPLRTSNRVFPTDLRQPRGFREVYQIPKGAASKYAGWFARVDGAVLAVFPRSQYETTEDGTVPLVPASTEFFFGAVPGRTPEAAPVSAAINTRVAGQGRLDSSDTTAVPSTAVANGPESNRVIEPPAAPAKPAPTDALAIAAAARALAEDRRLSRVAARVSDLFTDDRARDQRVGRLLDRAMGERTGRRVEAVPAGK